MNGSREQEHQADALAPEAEEGRAKLRKATGRRLKAREPWISEWGNPADRRSVTSGLKNRSIGRVRR